MTRSEEDFKAKIEAHVALETDQLMAEGLSARDARDQAIKKFEGEVAAQERLVPDGPRLCECSWPSG